MKKFFMETLTVNSKVFSDTVQYQLNKDAQSTNDFFFTIHPKKNGYVHGQFLPRRKKNGICGRCRNSISNSIMIGNPNPLKVNFIRVSRVLGDGETAMLHFDAMIPPCATKLLLGFGMQR
jgi:hypothetical protein